MKNASTPVAIRHFRNSDTKGAVFHGDAETLLKSLPDNAASLIFLDPPFNLRKTYGASKLRDSKPEDVYRAWLFRVIDESVRVLKPGCSLFLYHLPSWALQIGGHIGATLSFRHWIAVSMKNGFARGTRLYPAHYALLYYSKGFPRFFKRPKLKPQRCRHCGELVKDYGGYLPIIQKKGLNLSDVWEDLSPVRHANRKTRSSNELPEKLMSRILQIAGRRGQLYVEPFCGSGVGAVAAARAGMTFMVGDVVRKYAILTANRVHKDLQQKVTSRS